MLREAASSGLIVMNGVRSLLRKDSRWEKEVFRNGRAIGQSSCIGNRAASAGALSGDSRGGIYAGSGSRPICASPSEYNSHLPDGVGKPPSANGAKTSGRFSLTQPSLFSLSTVTPSSAEALYRPLIDQERPHRGWSYRHRALSRAELLRSALRRAGSY